MTHTFAQVLLLEIREYQRLRTRCRKKEKEGNWEKKLHIKKIRKQNRTKTKKEKERKKEKKKRIISRIRTPHLRSSASPPFHYTTKRLVLDRNSKIYFVLDRNSKIYFGKITGLLTVKDQRNRMS